MRITIMSRSGRVEVKAVDGLDGVTVRGAAMRTEGDDVVIDGGSSTIDVQCPPGADIVVATATGRVALRGPLGDVTVTSRSGKVEVEHAGNVEIRTLSGAIAVGSSDGDCHCVANSGRVEIGRAARAEVSAGAGRVTIHHVGDAEVTAASGRVDIASEAGTNVRVRTRSGRVRVELPPDARPRTTVSSKAGRVRCDRPSGDSGSLDIETTTGAIEVACAS